MKKFEDLVFEDHDFINGGKQATLWFENGYGVSVLFGERFECGFYSNGVDTYELAVMSKQGLTYPMEDDVVGFLTANQVTDYMKKVQDLSVKEYVYPGSDVQQ